MRRPCGSISTSTTTGLPARTTTSSSLRPRAADRLRHRDKMSADWEVSPVKLCNIAMLAALSLAVSVPPAFAQGSRPQATSEALPKSVRVVEAATPLRTGPGVTYPIVVTEDAGTVLEATGREDDWYRITLSPGMVADSNAPRTV